MLRLTGFVNEDDVVIMDRNIITRSYATSWFLPDLMSSIPFSLMFPGGDDGGDGSGSDAGGNSADYARTSKTMKLLRLIRLVSGGYI